MIDLPQGTIEYRVAGPASSSRPPVVFVSDGEAREVVRRETYADLMSRDVG